MAYKSEGLPKQTTQYNNHSYPCHQGCAVYVGPPGPPGMCGCPGMQGVQGPAGPAGPAGVPGQPGPQGKDGAQGSQGPVGPQGERGLRGHTGAQGPIGPTGPQGATGSTGPQGIQGVQGAQGPQGDTGEQGPKGDTGLQGLQGIRGATGATGAPAPGAQDFFDATVTKPEVLQPGALVAFDNVKVQSGAITYDNVTNEITINKDGVYLVNWWMNLTSADAGGFDAQSGVGLIQDVTGAATIIALSNTTLPVAATPAGPVYKATGTTIVVVNNSPQTFALRNVGPYATTITPGTVLGENNLPVGTEITITKLG